MSGFSTRYVDAAFFLVSSWNLFCFNVWCTYHLWCHFKVSFTTGMIFDELILPIFLTIFRLNQIFQKKSFFKFILENFRKWKKIQKINFNKNRPIFHTLLMFVFYIIYSFRIKKSNCHLLKRISILSSNCFRLQDILHHKCFHLFNFHSWLFNDFINNYKNVNK